jgi:hypothetical protein
MIFIYIVYGLYLAQYDIAILPSELVAESPKGFWDYRGITHVRSSDPSSVIQAAQTADLDFLSVTELNVYDRDESSAGYHGNLLVMEDGEYSYLNSRLLNIGASTSRHLQGVGRSQVIFADLLSSREKEKDVGMLILANPMDKKYQWSGEYPLGLDGIELINLKEMWNAAWAQNKISFFFSLFVFPFQENLGLLRLIKEPTKELELWDELSQRRPMVALAGAGADGKLRFPNYETVFSLWRNHVLLKSELTGNTTNDIEKLSQAMRQGQFYMSLDILGNPKGFNAVLKTKSDEILPMGSQLPYRDGMILEVRLPQKPKVPFDTIIYRDGVRMMTSNAQTTQYYVNAPGVYRVAVRVIPTLPLPDGKKWIPWIFTNAFYLQAKSGSSSP